MKPYEEDMIQRFIETEEGFNKIEKMLEEKKRKTKRESDHPAHWFPEAGKYLVTLDGISNSFVSSRTTLSHGLEYDSKESAEKTLKSLYLHAVLLNLANELNGDWVADWDDYEQPKFVLKITTHSKNNRLNNKLFIINVNCETDSHHYSERDLTQIIFKSFEDAKYAAQVIYSNPLLFGIQLSGIYNEDYWLDYA